MDEDPRITPADKTWVVLIRDLLCRRKKAGALFFGAMAGMGVGFLNLSVAGHDQALEELFDVLDCPVIWLMDILKQRFGPFGDNADIFYLLVAIICYWTLIGLFLAWIFCVIRRHVFTDVVKGIALDGICRRALFYGTIIGMLIGCLNFAAVINNWKIGKSFEALTRPAMALIQTVWDQIIFRNNLQLESGTGMLYLLAAAIISVYWAAIGFFFASVFCFIRIVRKRKGAAVSCAPEC